MFDVMPLHIRIFRRPARFWKYRVTEWFRRLRRAYAYMRKTLSADDAQTMIVECKHQAGWYPLVILAVDDVLERACEEFADHPQMRSFISEGCYKVYRKWENYGDELEGAIRWAIEVAEEYAANESIKFVRIMDEAVPEDDEGEEA